MDIRDNHPRQPIYISVPSGPSNIYTSNDPFHGVVRVNPKSRCQRVTITFRGRTKCSITMTSGNGTTTYKEKPDFFSYTLELFSAETQDESYDILKLGITEDNRVELPFYFQWPEKIELSPGKKWTKSRWFEHEKGGPLPPSYKYTTFRGNNQSVEYLLEAKLYINSRSLPQIEVQCPLIFRPPRPSNVPGLSPTTQILRPISKQLRERGTFIRTHRFHPNYDPNRGLRGKIKEKWTKNNTTTPTVNFRLEPTFPSTIAAGEPVNFTLSLTHLSRSDEIVEAPPIYLRRVLVQLISQLHIRVPHNSMFHSDDDLTEKYDDRITLMNRVFEGEGVMIYDGLPVKTKTFPLGIAPQFRNWGLSLGHMVEVRVWGECGKESFATAPAKGKVSIATSERRGGDAEVGANGEPPTLNCDVAPPPYRELC